MHRRAFLRASALAGAVGLSGCAGAPDRGPAADAGGTAGDESDDSAVGPDGSGASTEQYAARDCDGAGDALAPDLSPGDWPARAVTPAGTAAHPTATIASGPLDREWRTPISGGVYWDPRLSGPIVDEGIAAVYGGRERDAGERTHLAWIDVETGRVIETELSHPRRPPVLADGASYTDRRRDVAAVEPVTGERLWVGNEWSCDGEVNECPEPITEDPHGLFARQIVPRGDVVYVTADRTLLAYDRRDGSERWRSAIERGWPGLLLVAPERAYVADDGGVEAVDLTEREPVWSTDAVSADRGFGAVTAGGTLVVGSGTDLVGLDACRGERLWQFDPAGDARDQWGSDGLEVSADAGPSLGTVPDSEGVVGIAAADDRVFAAADALYALDAETGAIEWTWSAPSGQPLGRPVVVDGRVLTTDERTLFAVDPESGRTVRSDGLVREDEAPLLPARPAVVDGRVLVSTRSAVIAAE